MKHSIYTLLIIACAWSIQSNAQTPYDSFSPETSRPMLGIEVNSMADTINRSLTPNATPTTDNIRKWLSVDPLADKYPNISPYAYCGWNPINAIDPDGKDYTVNIDDETNTMNISAKYYVGDASAESAQQAIDFWNSQSGQYAYKTEDKQYTITFDLQLEVRDDFSAALVNDPSDNVNAYVVREPMASNTSGFCSKGNQIMVSPLYQSGETGAHEIGHTLGMVHSEYGIMTPGQDSPGRRPEITRGNIQQCISNAFSRYSNSTEAKGTINGIVNRYGKVIKLQ